MHYTDDALYPENMKPLIITAAPYGPSWLPGDTTDIAEMHFRLASLLRDDSKPDAARRHVLMALEEAPRFLAAHKLLLELAPKEADATAAK